MPYPLAPSLPSLGQHSGEAHHLCMVVQVTVEEVLHRFKGGTMSSSLMKKEQSSTCSTLKHLKSHSLLPPSFSHHRMGTLDPASTNLQAPKKPPTYFRTLVGSTLHNPFASRDACSPRHGRCRRLVALPSCQHSAPGRRGTNSLDRFELFTLGEDEKKIEEIPFTGESPACH